MQKLTLGMMCCLLAAAVEAETIQVDFSSVFTHDAIGNTGDDANDVIDNLHVYTTNAWAKELSPTAGNGLPDDGFFPRTAFHPPVQLGYRDSDNGDNVLFQLGALGSVKPDAAATTIDIPNDFYSELHVFSASSGDTAGMTVRLNYTSGAPDVFALGGFSGNPWVPDWFDDDIEDGLGGVIPDEFFNDWPYYYLVNGLDRVQLFTVGTLTFATLQNHNDPAIFGFRFDPDTSRILDNFSIERNFRGNLLTFGATAVTFEQALPGDANNDGAIDNLDITPFIAALAAEDETAFLSTFPGGNYAAADVDMSGLPNNLDITPFIGLLTAAGSNATAVPEPSSIAWLALALMFGPRRMTRHAFAAYGASPRY